VDDTHSLSTFISVIIQCIVDSGERSFLIYIFQEYKSGSQGLGTMFYSNTKNN
jgi:hypothetical protein